MLAFQTTKGYDQTPLIHHHNCMGFLVFVAAFITGQFSGAHLNPAVTIGLVIAGKFSSELMIGYIIAQVLGAMLGSWLTYLFYIDVYRSTNDESKVMGSFCTSPAIRNLKNNFFSEFLATFILIFGILYIVKPNILIEGMNANFGIGSSMLFPVGILVWVIGLSLGGTTGYAINPARDLGPRIVYQLIQEK